MKKIIAIFLFIALTVLAGAKTISESEALYYAQRFFGNPGASDLQLVWTGDDNSTPSFYAFNNRKGGFVIISAEDAAVPVLGYSFKGEFKKDGMPENLRNWFSGMEESMKAIRADKIQQGSEVRAQWNSVGVKTKAVADEILLRTAEWYQFEPYNYYCDIPDGKKAATGCVATAMSIYMRYVKHPEHGYGTLDGYRTSSYNYSIPSICIDDHYYDWDSMPLLDSEVKEADEETQHKIAQLIHDCGVSVYMDYSESSSGTAATNIATALIRHFGFSSKARYCEKDFYSYDEWTSMIKKELNQNRPVIYGGQDYKGRGGHSFIIDGYDANNMWHVNWGWAGSDNGYYILNLTIGTKYSFSKSQHAVFDLEPALEQEVVEAHSDIQLMSRGILLKEGEIVQGKDFTINPYYIANRGLKDYEGWAVPALVGADGTVKARISQPQELELPAMNKNGFYLEAELVFVCRIEDEIEFGDGVEMLYLIPGTEDEYAPIKYDKSATLGRLTTIPFFIDIPSGKLKAGDVLELKTEGGQELFSSMEWYLDDQRVEGYIIIVPQGRHVIKLKANSDSGKRIIVQEIEAE